MGEPLFGQQRAVPQNTKTGTEVPRTGSLVSLIDLHADERVVDGKENWHM